MVYQSFSFTQLTHEKSYGKYYQLDIDSEFNWLANVHLMEPLIGI